MSNTAFQLKGPEGAGGGGGMITADAPEVKAGGLFLRLVAAFIDTFILSILTTPISLIFTGKAQVALMEKDMSTYFLFLGLSFVLGLAPTLFYYIWFYTKKGATPGKLVMGLTVVDSNTGARLTVGQIILREIIGKWVFVFSMIFLGLGFFLAVFRDDKRTLADFIGGSRVVRKF
jgi:uncharacterized RDD family membrane protein YckC